LSVNVYGFTFLYDGGGGGYERETKNFFFFLFIIKEAMKKIFSFSPSPFSVFIFPYPTALFRAAPPGRGPPTRRPSSPSGPPSSRAASRNV
jgi:hypothetical protein